MAIYNLEEILANMIVIASIMKLILPGIWYTVWGNGELTKVFSYYMKLGK